MSANNHLFSSAVEAFNKGGFDEAEVLCKKALEYNPLHSDCYHLLGLIAQKRGDLTMAIKKIRQAISLHGKNHFYFHNLAQLLEKTGQEEDAIELYKKGLQIAPEFTNTLFALGKLYKKKSHANEAKNCFSKLLSIDPKHVPAINNLANILQLEGQLGEAELLYKKAMEINNILPEPVFNLANIFLTRKNFPEAVFYLEICITQHPNYLNAWKSLLAIHQSNNEATKALELLKKAVITFPNNDEFLFALASAYKAKDENILAMDYYKRALLINPLHLMANCNLGNHYLSTGYYEEAEFFLKKAYEIDPSKSEVLLGLAKLYEYTKRYSESLTALQTLLEKSNDYYLHVLFEYTLAKLRIGDWDNYEELLKKINEQTTLYLSDPKQIYRIAPLTLSYLPLTEKLHLEVAQKHAALIDQDVASIRKELNFIHKERKNRKIRIGYVSPDFRLHAVGLLLKELFEHHDKNSFEIYAYSIVNTNDEYNQHFKKNADVFRDIGMLSDEAAAKKIYEDEIDFLIDLAGNTTYSRSRIFALRPAPIQIGFMGYPDTMGGNSHDYILADRWLIPESSQKYYSEKIIYLPQAFASSKLSISKKETSRAMFGLPEKAFVYCCFNSFYKISPLVFASWMEILKNVPNSVLWLSKENKEGVLNFKKEAEKQGVDPNRLIFAERIAMDEYLKSYEQADLFLDTFYYSAGSTAVCALYAGLPMLTYAGNTNSARMGASILSGTGLESLIMSSTTEYSNKAIQLGNEPESITFFKKHLKQALSDGLLFNIQTLAKNIEIILKNHPFNQ